MRTLIDYHYWHYWARDRMLDAVSYLSADQFTRERGSSFSLVRDALADHAAAELEPIAQLPSRHQAMVQQQPERDWSGGEKGRLE